MRKSKAALNYISSSLLYKPTHSHGISSPTSLSLSFKELKIMRAFCALAALSSLCIIGASAPRSSPNDESIEDIIDESLFERMLLHRSTSPCVGAFYTYDAFLAAASQFKGFGTTGDLETRKREIAAFLAHTSHETTGGWDGAPDGRYSWGYCWIREGMTMDPSLLGDYCFPSDQWPCAAGKKYYGRGPFQLTYNYNYGQAGEALGIDLLGNPDLVEQNPYVSFLAAFWFWMTPQEPKPSCHEAMTGIWEPTQEDLEGNIVPGFGMTIEIINGGLECRLPFVIQQTKDRIGFYETYCEIFGVDPGPVDCPLMRPYALTSMTTPGIKNATHYVQSE